MTPTEQTPPAAGSEAARRRVVHMIGNAHIDPVWLWRWPEGYAEARATFWSAIHRLEEYDDFVFTCNQIALVAWVEEADPALFAAIRERVADGRWVFAGGWWVEPDCNVPHGESFCRQGLYGQRYLREKFGVTARAGLNADPFGHHANIPQILAGQGMTSYCFLRPGPHENELPGPVFWWESPDGSRVLACRIPHEYCGPRADIVHHTEKAVAQLPPGLTTAMVFYGVGNHGGGPTRANLDSIRDLDAGGSLGRLTCSTPERYARELLASTGDGAELPVWRGDLQRHAAGCYAAHSDIKTWTRRAEHALLAAEKWAAVATIAGGATYPRDELTRAWKQVLFNQFHDILPGTAIAPAYEDARDQLGEARAIARRVSNLARQTLARDVDVPFIEGTQPVLVFNPLPWPVRDEVEVELALPDGPDRVLDDAGATVPSQPIQPDATMSDRNRRRLAFPVELPALGYRLYRIAPGPRSGAAQPSPAGAEATGSQDPPVLENPHLRVEVDPATGWLRRLLDRHTGQDLIASGDGSDRPHTVVSDDPTDTWGHRVVSYVAAGQPFRCRSVRLVENGPVRSVLRVESRFGDSSLREDLILGGDARHLEIRVRLDWREQLRLLKLRIPTALARVTATYEIPYGHLVRPADSAEQPGQSWVDLSGNLPDGSAAGLSVITDVKSAYDVGDRETGADLGITAVRSPAYAWHDPRELDADATYRYQDQGPHEFSYLLLPHDGDWRAAGTVRAAARLAQPPTALFEAAHPGHRPASDAYVQVDGDPDGAVVPTVVKCSEDDPDSLVVRAYESHGRPARASLQIPARDRSFEADFGAHQIRTFLVPLDPALPVTETDLLERPLNTEATGG